ncbi:MAG: acyltransferase [Myxococcales bacterium]|nr:acyltransferase [Polyangiaceae bacterium]MDW8250600.1 acyltransferase [Myxococcales bacterium]
MQTSSPRDRVDKVRERIHFPRLDGLRSVAALAVVVAHLESKKGHFGFGEHALPRLLFLGQTGVSLFFVLSGYLITFLLLVERQIAGTIDIKKFLIRRALRIWPLYFLILLLGFFFVPQISFFDVPGQTEHLQRHFLLKLLLFLAFQPNLALIVFAPIPYASQAWSIGIEEQFYVAWPFVVRRARSVVAVATTIIAAVAIARGGVELLRAFAPLGPRPRFLVELASRFFLYSRYECMAVGAIFAALAFEGRAAFLRTRAASLLALVLLCLFFSFDASLPFLGHLPQALGFGLLVTCLAHGPNEVGPFRLLETPLMMYLGKISYGIYMVHLLCITPAGKATAALLPPSAPSLSVHGLLYTFTLALVLGVSALSYRFLEKPFLRLKDRFTIVRSGAQDPTH